MLELRPRLARLARLVRFPRLDLDPSLMLWGAGLVLAFLFVWEQASVDRLVMRLEKAEAQRLALESEVNALAMEADQLSSLGQVESRAHRELGLIRPATDQIVQLRFEESMEESPRFGLDPLVPEATAGTREEGPRR